MLMRLPTVTPLAADQKLIHSKTCTLKTKTKRQEEASACEDLRNQTLDFVDQFKSTFSEEYYTRTTKCWKLPNGAEHLCIREGRLKSGLKEKHLSRVFSPQRALQDSVRPHHILQQHGCVVKKSLGDKLVHLQRRSVTPWKQGVGFWTSVLQPFVFSGFNE